MSPASSKRRRISPVAPGFAVGVGLDDRERAFDGHDRGSPRADDGVGARYASAAACGGIATPSVRADYGYAQRDLAEVLARLHRAVRLGRLARAAARGRPRARARPASSAAPKRAEEAATSAAFSSTGRARSVEPITESRRASSAREVDLGLRAAHEADQHEPPADRERGEVALEVGRADRVEHHVDAAPAGRLLRGRDEVAGRGSSPRRRRRARGSAGTSRPSPRSRPRSRPRALGELDAAVPIPLPPPCTSTAPPAGSAPSWNTVRNTVR